ncbi:MAG: C40 family peptidase [Taibaiella sp.]|nr:C40 family peptidase [Taibaiella sp.]
MPLRSEPAHKAEQVNQLLFGEKAEVLKVNDKDWAYIRCEWDGYEGWCKTGQLALISRKEYRKAPRYWVADHYSRFIFEGSEMWLPLGADLFGMSGGKININKSAARFKGKKVNIHKEQANCETLLAAAHKYMNAPYQWGGRTVAGIDCSGLIHMAFKLCGRAIPRDASQQALQGEVVDFLQHAVCGDLAFFDNPEGKIVHVGLLLDNERIMHANDASGRVVIDRIDQEGIISTSLRRRTHHLRVVKRYII